MSPSLPKTYKAVVVEAAGAPLKIAERELEQPGPGQILVKVLACGVCHSDVGLQQGGFGDKLFPRVPGHEIIGDVVAVGDGVQKFSVGERAKTNSAANVSGACFRFARMQSATVCPRTGGYAEYVLLRAEAVARVPKDMDPAEVAPLLCAGVTVFNSIRKMSVEQGSLIAIQGVGGLGHLAVQYANKMGYKVAVISSSASKKDFAIKLGAHEYIDTSTTDAVKRLQELGGAGLIIATAPNPKIIGPLTAGLQSIGKLCILAPVGTIEVNSIDIITRGRSITSWPGAHALDLEDAIDFAKTHGVKCMVERFSLDDVQKATDHMISNQVRFRSVLVME
ncbi:alcohol dehydrogenase [Fusarium sp. LHS14.1]|nr:alcohol dehydrogenase [Fusarium sp. LHS14.1]